MPEPKENIKKFRMFVNGRQTKEERKEKYRKLRKCRLSVALCIRMRDWTNSHITLFLKSNKNEIFK